MTEQQFDERIKAIETEYNRKREGADAYQDQELARLFVECRWTQEAIGKRIGWTKGRVCQRLLLGRFLEFTARKHSDYPLNSLTEWRFRQHWPASKRHAKDTEDERFSRVFEALRADHSETPKGYGNLVKKPGIKAAVIAALQGGRRLTTPEIAAIVSETIPDTGADQVNSALRYIQRKPPRGMAFEARHSGRTHKYRLVDRKGPPPAPPIDPERAGAAALDSLPLIEECIRTLKKPELQREITMALDHLSRVRQTLRALLVPEEVA